MKSHVSGLIKEHFMNHIALYFITILSFTIGVCTGAFTVNALDQTQAKEIYVYLEDFFNIINGQSIDYGAVFKLSIYNNLKFVVLLWLLGITVIGMPFILIFIGIKGFAVGFTVGFLINSFNFQGVLFVLMGILPQNIIMVPCYIILGTICIHFSLDLVQLTKNKRYGKQDLRARFFSYSTFVILIFITLMVGSIVEAYIAPVFIKTVVARHL